MKRRNGYTDFAIPVKLLRDRLVKTIRENPRLNHEELVRHGVNKIMLGGKLFAQYETEFLSYIVTNALNMAECDLRAAGVNPVTGADFPASRLDPAPRPQPKPLSAEQVRAEQETAEKQAKVRLTELAPILWMKLPTIYAKPLGECTREEGLKIGGATAAMFKKLVPVGSKKRLCDVASEAQLRDIWAKQK